MASRLFLERRTTYQLAARHNPLSPLVERTALLGVNEAQRTEYRYASGQAAVSARLDEWPRAIRERGEPLLESSDPIAEELEEARALYAWIVQAGTERNVPGLRVLLYRSWQDVLIGSEDVSAMDRRVMLILELSGSCAPTAECWRALSFRDWDQLRLAGTEIQATLDEIANVLGQGAPLPCPRGGFEVVFPPGAAAGSFFHEVCGHPLEGDVVARGGSYLARRPGELIAPEFVTISDDPSRGDGCTYAVDDQGSPATRVPLINRGRVAGPLVDLEVAAELRVGANGHGRCVDFRHPPLPRMAHTQVEPHQGMLAEFVDGIGAGLLIQHLTPRHMNLLSGEFSFFINEGRWIERGKLKQLIGPAVLRGRGDQALRNIVAVGADYRPLFSIRGCRKLDHGPLHVSFGQPAIRFSELTVEPW